MGLVFVGVVLGCANLVLGDPYGPSAAYQKVIAVVKDGGISNDQKIVRLTKFTGDEETRMIALYQIELLDPGRAMQTAAGIFRAKDSSRQTKLQIGRFMMTRSRPGRFGKKGFPKEFVKEFAKFLVGAVLDGGQKEFCVAVPEGAMTAVGEYAYLSSYFQGYKGVDFKPFKDTRLVPILLSGLNAPDNVHSDASGCCRHGKPGEATGRNTARQQIPIALARLGDARAISPLRWVLDKHYDWHQRNNAAYALAMLQPPGDHAKLAARMLAQKHTNVHGRLDEAKDRYRHLFAFGRGLLARGDDAGIEFMAFKYSIYDADKGLSEVTYMVSERLEVLKGVKSPKLAGFFKQAFARESVMGMLLMDKTKVKVNDYGHTVYDFAKAKERIEKLFDSICKLIEANKLTSQRAAVQQIARGSASEVIRRRAEKCVAKLALREKSSN
jgi:hypothetical protein